MSSWERFSAVSLTFRSQSERAFSREEDGGHPSLGGAGSEAEPPPASQLQRAGGNVIVLGFTLGHLQHAAVPPPQPSLLLPPKSHTGGKAVTTARGSRKEQLLSMGTNLGASDRDRGCRKCIEEPPSQPRSHASPLHRGAKTPRQEPRALPLGLR